MAIEPLGAPQPIKLAIAPLAAAQEVLRLTQEQNQRVRESRLEADEASAREARRDAEAARVAAQEEARADTAAQDSPGGNGGTETRGETVDIFA